jgi:oxygen-independent coproporphyrinogen-3 oxidase
MLDTCCQSFFFTGDTPEISIEVNPATVEEQELEQLFQAGFNRLSIGVQTFSNRELQLLGRLHTSEHAEATVRAAQRAGFADVSLDLMFALPGQTVSGWQETLARACDLGPDHLSIYELTIEEGSVFAQMKQQGKLSLPGEEQVLEMMAVTLEETAKNGLYRYEISSYARPGKECRHNINYWQNGPYIGIGAGAVSCLSGRRFRGIADIDEYCLRIETGQSPYVEMEELDTASRFRETVIMGLRMTAGVSIPELAERFGIEPVEYYGETIRHLQDSGLVVVEEEHLRLTDTGLRLANRVMAELV